MSQLMWREQKRSCHVAVYAHVRWLCVHTPGGACICVRARMSACVRARVCACASGIREIKHPFHDNAISLNCIYLIEMSNGLNLCHVGLSFCFNMHKWRGVAWSDRSHDLIAINRHLSEGVCGALWFVSELFWNDLMSAIHLGVIMAKIKTNKIHLER